MRILQGLALTCFCLSGILLTGCYKEVPEEAITTLASQLQDVLMGDGMDFQPVEPVNLEEVDWSQYESNLKIELYNQLSQSVNLEEGLELAEVPEALEPYMEHMKEFFAVSAEGVKARTGVMIEDLPTILLHLNDLREMHPDYEEAISPLLTTLKQTYDYAKASVIDTVQPGK